MPTPAAAASRTHTAPGRADSLPDHPRTQAGRARRPTKRHVQCLPTDVLLVALAASALAGAATLLLLKRRVFEPARYTAAAAVGAVVIGWGVAQAPFLLPGLTVQEAAAGEATLLAITFGVLAGSVVLVPSLALLFRMVLRGGFGPMAPTHSHEPHDRVTTGAAG